LRKMLVSEEVVVVGVVEAEEKDIQAHTILLLVTCRI
jgi:hypothetical protein